MTRTVESFPKRPLLN